MNNMLKAADKYFFQQPEPARACLLAMRQLILSHNSEITEAWKYGMPFYCYQGKMCCYLWTQKKTGQPYIGFVEGKQLSHPLLIQEKRARMKIMLLNPAQDLPVKTIYSLLKKALALYH
jgi:Domain of unknown function (DU1801)